MFRTPLVLAATGLLLFGALTIAAPPAAAIDCVQVIVDGVPTDPCSTVLGPVCSATSDKPAICHLE
jgi:hypothetical protein